MAEPASLGDFFKQKGKKKIKGTNLNAKAEEKTEAKKPKAKDAEEEAWAAEDEVIAASGLKVEAAGKLPTAGDEKKEEEEGAAPKWGRANKGEKDARNDLSDRKYPSLAKSVQSTIGGNSNIIMDDKANGQVNITTHKNVFSALENEDADEDDGAKRPGKIMPAMVQKKKGEMNKAAIEREVQKYKKEDSKKGKASKADKDEDEDDDEDEEEDEDEEKPEEKPVEEVKEKKKKKEFTQVKAAEPKPQENVDDEDTRIQPDLAAAKAKYAKRRKLPHKALPKSELEEEKENKPKQPIGGKKKKGCIMEDEEGEKKLAYAPF